MVHPEYRSRKSLETGAVHACVTDRKTSTKDPEMASIKIDFSAEVSHLVSCCIELHSILFDIFALRS